MYKQINVDLHVAPHEALNVGLWGGGVTSLLILQYLHGWWVPGIQGTPDLYGKTNGLGLLVCGDIEICGANLNRPRRVYGTIAANKTHKTMAARQIKYLGFWQVISAKKLHATLHHECIENEKNHQVSKRSKNI